MSSTFQTYLQVWKEWQITVLMLTTMCFQIILVAAGFYRKRLSTSPFRFIVWLAFIGLDAIAAYAVGLMLGGGCDAVFAVWAPALLFHLGAADAISAYSVVDNDLWQRHSLKMTLEVMAAGYILSRAGESPPFLAAGVMLFVVGAYKYIERVHALWCGSAAQVVSSSRAIYRFMAADRRQEAGVEAADHPLIVSGEAAWYANYRLTYSGGSGGTAPRLSDIDCVVTYEDILKCRELRSACRYIHDLCLAFALYKIYRRRLSNLRIHHTDDDYHKVSRILFPSAAQLSPLRVIRVIEAEVGFIHDGAFTKGGAAAASGWWFQGAAAMAARMLSVFLLFVSVMALLAGGAAHITCQAAEVHLAGGVTLILAVTCFLVECAQACKAVRSNRTRVWLACAYVVERRRERHAPPYTSLNRMHRRNARLLLAAFRYAGVPFSRPIWHERIDQRSIVADAMDDVRWRSAAVLDVSGYSNASARRGGVLGVAAASASDVHYYLVEKVGERFAGISPQELAKMRDGIARAVRFPLEAAEVAAVGVPEFSAASDSGLEAVLLHWHVATSVCERDLYGQSGGGGEAAKIGVALSRYCLYLLVDCTKLTAADGDVVAPLYYRMRSRLARAFAAHPATMDIRRDCEAAEVAALPEEEAAGAAVLAYGIDLGKRIAARWGEAAERWAVLVEVWVDIMVYMAIAENAHPHAEAMGKGGELLSHLWVLLGHMGLAHSSWMSRPHVAQGN